MYFLLRFFPVKRRQKNGIRESKRLYPDKPLEKERKCQMKREIFLGFLIAVGLLVAVFLFANLVVSIYIGWLVPTSTSFPVTRLTPTASPIVTPSLSTSLAHLQVGVITRLISPSRNEVRVKLISKEIYSEVEHTLRLEIFENEIWNPRTITQTTNIAPSVTVVTKGFIVIPSDWSSLYEKEIGFGETVEFFRVDNSNRASFKFVKRSQDEYVDVVIQSGNRQTGVNLCPHNCGSSLGMGYSELNGIDVLNSYGFVKILFHDPWRLN